MKAGDCLPLHNHTYADVHITIVARGSVYIHGPSFDPMVHKSGAVVDFEDGHPHEIIACEDNARIINIVKHH